jgi:hypothetical protein|tara:strand:+ start:412 stop:573 length:162 start_codon:yes stop_codon:yes gene_type:complete
VVVAVADTVQAQLLVDLVVVEAAEELLHLLVEHQQQLIQAAVVVQKVELEVQV